MKLSKAIFNSENAAFRLEREGFEEWAEAVKLGREAMRAWEGLRNSPASRFAFPLPGEDKE